MRLTTYLCVASILLISGCGGGGSSNASGSDSTTSGNGSGTQPNLKSATAPSQPMSVSSTTLTATDSSGNTYTATYSSTPGGMAMFNGQNADTSQISLTVWRNGTVVSTEVDTAYYLLNPYSPLGLAGTTNAAAWTAYVTSFTPFPSTLTVGASGPVLSGTYYVDGVEVGGLTETYTVTADSPTALALNINATGSINGTQVAETLTFSITNGGASTLVGAQITVNGTTLTFQ